MAKQGSHFREFNPDPEDWVSYTERLVQYSVANNITDEGDTRRAVLLGICGAPTHQLIPNLVAPAKPMEKSFPQIVELVQEHHQPVIVQRFNFHIRMQQPTESVSDFVAQLRKLSEHCDLGATLQDMLCDRLV